MRRAALMLLFVSVATAMANPPPYIQTYSAQFNAGNDSLLREILAELRQMRLELATIRKLQQPAVVVAPPPASLGQLVKLRCAECHAWDSAEKKGAGFVLLAEEGKVPPLSLAEKRRIARMVSKDEMPPKLPLTELEKRALEEFLNPKE